MNAVSKNLKEIRQAKGLTQDQLAEALHVTRQAVSNWETGRSEPDIETLLALAEALDTGADALIYGPKPPKYEPMQKKYIICCVVFGLILLAGIAAIIWLEPWLLENRKQTFDMTPSLYYILVMKPLVGASCGALLGSLLSLGLDLRLKRPRRIVCLILGICCLVPALVTGAQFVSLIGRTRLIFPFVWNTQTSLWVWTRAVPFLGGFLIFLGFNRR